MQKYETYVYPPISVFSVYRNHVRVCSGTFHNYYAAGNTKGILSLHVGGSCSQDAHQSNTRTETSEQSARYIHHLVLSFCNQKNNNVHSIPFCTGPKYEDASMT